MELSQDFFAGAYLVATIFFIFGLKGLASPKTAVWGNLSAMVGMVLAVAVTLIHSDVKNYYWILIGIVPGAVIGIALAIKIQMTAMPQLVAILHSFVGLAAVLVAFGTYIEHSASGHVDTVLLVELAVGSFIGAITFTGSLIAFGKLQALLSSNPLVFKGQHALNLLLGLVMIAFTVDFVMHPDHMTSFLALTGIALLLGFLLVLPIGGGDMPVIVSMLNSYSGWAATATGFTLNNNLLITTGALVGSSGAILSYIMCSAMNRSIVSVVLGGFGGETGAGDSAVAQAANKGVKASSVEDAAFVMENASKIIIVPGYGMAVAQAQHSVKEMYEALHEKGIEVKFAIHPVAGRMPGHMNVLLAESEIPYEIVQEMDEINGEFSGTDVVFVIGANDVVNPDAKTNKSSPLYGMPILDAYKAKHVFVNKRSMKAGYAGVDNALFYMDNCSLVFGDAKSVSEHLVQALRGGGH
ncbi:MAG TPA: NAD(P)(+) transhydrogenase (Re/Si-specific) subunit beta [Bdellovibrionota bacterium]|jgi:NAD(P) transhydrogenase subunit beta